MFYNATCKNQPHPSFLHWGKQTKNTYMTVHATNWELCFNAWIQEMNHINVSNLLPQQGVKSAGSHCTRGSSDKARVGEGAENGNTTDLNWRSFVLTVPHLVPTSSTTWLMARWNAKPWQRSHNLTSQQFRKRKQQQNVIWSLTCDVWMTLKSKCFS